MTTYLKDHAVLFSAVAFIIGGVIAFSVATAQTTPTHPAPTNVSASATSKTSITLTYNTVAGATSYLAEYKKTDGGSYQDGHGGNSTNGTLVISGLEAGTSYTFRVRTQKPNIGSWSTEAVATTNADIPFLIDIIPPRVSGDFVSDSHTIHILSITNNASYQNGIAMAEQVEIAQKVGSGEWQSRVYNCPEESRLTCPRNWELTAMPHPRNQVISIRVRWIHNAIPSGWSNTYTIPTRNPRLSI